MDSVVEAARDLGQAYGRSRSDTASQQGCLAQTLPAFLQQLERLAQRCSTSEAHNTLVGKSLTLADVVCTTPSPSLHRTRKPYIASSMTSLRQSCHCARGRPAGGP